MDQRGGRSWEKLGIQEKGAMVAEWLGWKLVDETPHPEHRKRGQEPDLWYQEPGGMLHRIPADRGRRRRDPELDFCPTLYLDDARVVEDEIERRGLQGAYSSALEEITGLDWRDWEDGRPGALWPIICATSDQRCLAALRAGGVEV